MNCYSAMLMFPHDRPSSLLAVCYGQVYMKQFGDDFEAGGVEWGGVFLDED